MCEHSIQSNRSKVKRVPKRGLYDKESIFKILDAAYLANIGFQFEGQTFVIPTLYGRADDYLYIHGAASSRMLKQLLEQSICLTVTLVDGLVLARSSFHHSMNYRSVVLLGKAELITEKEEKIRGLEIISEHLIQGRWDEVRGPNAKELKATSIFKLKITEGSAKVRTGHPKDEKADYDLNVWAGEIPLKTVALAPINDDLLREGISISKSVTEYYTQNTI